MLLFRVFSVGFQSQWNPIAPSNQQKIHWKTINNNFRKPFQNSFWIFELFFITLRHGIEIWCNGSTTDFGSVCPGSNPGISTVQKSPSKCPGGAFPIKQSAPPYEGCEAIVPSLRAIDSSLRAIDSSLRARPAISSMHNDDLDIPCNWPDLLWGIIRCVSVELYGHQIRTCRKFA